MFKLFLNGETEIIDVVEQYDQNEGVITLAPPQHVIAASTRCRRD
jgi:hypothetical protein